MDKKQNREYMRNYMRLRWRARREKAIQQLGGRCAVCGRGDTLEFDHVERHKKHFSIASFPSMNERDFQKELQKCQLLCGKCHSNKTQRELEPVYAALRVHGTLGRYQAGCRCSACKIRKRDSRKRAASTDSGASAS